MTYRDTQESLRAIYAIAVAQGGYFTAKQAAEAVRKTTTAKTATKAKTNVTPPATTAASAKPAKTAAPMAELF